MHVLDICQYLAILYGVEILKSNAAAATTTEGISPRVYHEIKKICKEHGIIHDVIGGAPEHKMKVAYNKNDYIDFGTFLTVDQIKEKPTLIEWPCSSNLLYTLMLISPDYPTRENPKEKEWQYWLVTNIHGGDLKLSQTLTEYSPPTEIHGKEPHRMIFMVFLQSAPRAVNFNEPYIKKETISKERAHFNTREFAKKHNFTKLVALNFFLMKPTKKT
nr:PREDICTED: protein D3-like isoform X3 [Bemisia tabaci]